MLAPRPSQENVLALRPGAVRGRSGLNPVTRYPKTPLRAGKYDENSTPAVIGKSTLGNAVKVPLNDVAGEFKINQPVRQALVTPMQPQSRAPLGNKSTNVLRTGRNVLVKQAVNDTTTFDKPQSAVKKYTAVKRQTQLSIGPDRRVGVESMTVTAKATSVVVNGHDESEVEYAPPPVAEPEYESDIFPEGFLTFEGLRPENLYSGYYETYVNPMGQDGLREKERELAEHWRRAEQKAEEDAQKEADEFDWPVCDVPETMPGLRRKLESVVTPAPASTVSSRTDSRRTRGITDTLNMRTAAAALSGITTVAEKKRAAPRLVPARIVNKTGFSRPTAVARMLAPIKKLRQPAVSIGKTVTAAAAVDAASRCTLGYKQGRQASSLMQMQNKAVLPGSRTVLPSGFRPEFLALFNVDQEDDDLGIADDNESEEEEDEEFELKLD